MRELARRTGFSAATISDLINGHLNASPKMCRALADVFNVPPEQVFRKAGLLPDYPEDLDRNNIAQLLEYYRGLSYEERLRLVEHAKWVYEREQAKKRTGK